MTSEPMTPANPPAFPSVCLNDPCHEASVPGMSLRDWFAGQALGSALLYAISDEKNPIRCDLLPEEWAAKIALATADAMLAARTGAA